MLPKNLWNPSFSVGNATLDEQHKVLLGVCYDLMECAKLQGSSGFSRVHELLDVLARYTREHFSTEERILSACGYAELEQQKAEHLAYEEELMRVMFDAMTNKIDIQEIERFASGWWTGHILESDMKYKEVISGAESR